MSGGWTVVDSATNKSLPLQGTANSGANSPYFTPSLGQQDPVGKFRTSTPQALIDTDFEYGTQPTKWESIALQQNRQSVYYIPQQPLNVSAITGTATANVVTITFTGTVPSGAPIFIQNSSNATINGWGYVVTGGTSTTINVVLAPGSATIVDAAAYYNAALTYVYVGYFYSSCGIQVAAGTSSVVVTSSTVITVTTVNPHGLVRGNYVYITGTTGGTNVNGAYIVATTDTANTFTVTALGASGTVTTAAGITNIYARPAGFVEPRTFDGGVAFSAGGAVPNQQLIRQTRRYFRYQSGKGIQFSTGSSLKPALFITSITGTGTTATVTSRYSHNLTTGSTIVVAGADQGVYNGSFTVASVTSPTVFTYTTQIPITVATATGPAIRISPNTWYGSANRVGMFDLQNGMFFEYDGQRLYAVLRNSINQINGTIAVTQGQSLVTGTGTQFSSQCAIGSYIVIRGQSYKVLTVTSDTVMYVSPEYRGSTLTGAVASLTLETRIPQSQWADPCNGTGPSGYNIDLTRMQMWYIDYSWYGAGVVRYGFRTSNGVISYVTQIQNNNRQFEAYMRTGNMAAHYESNGVAPVTILSASLSTGAATTTTAAINAADVSIPLTSVTNFNNTGVALIGSEYVYYTGISGTTLIGCTRGYGNTIARGYASGTNISPSSIDVLNPSLFPPTGTVKVTASSQTGVAEYITYAGNDGSILYGLTRGQTGGAAATAFTFSATAPVSVELTSLDTVPSLSHWGSSVIMDGRFDDDKSLIFNYGSTPLTTVTSTTQLTPVLAIRVAPSVDNGTVGTLGQKEIINRMQLQLFELGIYATGPLLVNLVLNGVTTGTYSGGFISPVTTAGGAFTSSLSQVAQNTTNTVTVTGGESVAAAFTNTNGQTTLDLSGVRDLGNSILGGGLNNTVPASQAGFYPDGPDILYVCVTPLTATAITVNARLSWKEAQA